MTTLLRLASALLPGVLALFPRRYRSLYGEERACVLRLALAEAAAGGWWPLLLCCAREARDLPLALAHEHWKEWRLNMRPPHSFPATPETPLSGRQLAGFLLPFLAVLLLPLRGWLQGNLWNSALLALLAASLGLAGAGLAKGLPRWALPGLGLALSLAELLVFPSLVSAVPGLTSLKFALWTDFMPGRVLYAVVMAILLLAPLLLLLIGLALISTWLPALSTFRRRLGQDWTLLAFLLFTSNLLTPFSNDPYRGLEPYQLLFIAILIGGAWPFLRGWGARLRMTAMLVATLLSGVAYAWGIYQIYPDPSWAVAASSEFPRLWESLLPLLDTWIRLAGLGLLALCGVFLSRGHRLKAKI
jgi:hypothetical protein